MNKPIAHITQAVIDALGLQCDINTPVYIGDSNITHMQQKHPEDYEKYKDFIPVIINTPDYVGTNHADNSIEYVKTFTINDEYVKVAVRVAASGRYYARSMYVLNTNRVKNFIKKGTLKAIK